MLTRKLKISTPQICCYLTYVYFVALNGSPRPAVNLPVNINVLCHNINSNIYLMVNDGDHLIIMTIICVINV